MNTLEAKHVTYRVGSRDILQDVSFAAAAGFTALIGPNGAGKTTLLRTLSGYLRPASGSVLLNGISLENIPVRERARHIAVVAQQSAAEYEFTVLDVVLMGRTAWKGLFEADDAHDRKIALDALREAGAEGLADRLITELSGGERQRVMIARAFCQQADILLLDEPVSALDLRYQVGILRAVQSHIEERAMSCVCVLHDLNLASHFADRIVLMSEGRITIEGDPEEVLRQDLLERIYRTSVRILRDENELLVLPDMRAGRQPQNGA